MGRGARPARRAAVTSGLALALLLVTLSIARGAAAATPSSDPEGAQGLLLDLERIVTARGSAEWFLDSTEYREISATVLQSVCSATPAARRLALEESARRVAVAGEPERLFAIDGELTPRVEQALFARRQHHALGEAVARADRDCPFWVRPEPCFRGRQTARRRWTLSIESGGNLQIRQTAESWTFGGGGLGRLLPGYGIGDRLMLLGGVEFGGGAMLRPGAPQTEFVVNYFPALPVVLRVRDVAWHYDFELGPVGLFQSDDTSLSYGGRIGASVGVSALRTRNLLPWAGFAGTYEYYLESGGRPAAHFFRGGLRVGVVWDP